MSEQADISTFLALDGQVFLAPQYNIAFESAYQDGGACPDFLALDFRCRNVVIVEVTTAANLSGLIKRAQERETRWYNPARRMLTKLSVIDERWRFRFLGLVRDDSLRQVQSRFSDNDDVTFFPVEKATFPWLYWDDRIKNGLPGALI